MNIAFSALVQIKVVTGKFCKAARPLQHPMASFAQMRFFSQKGQRDHRGFATVARFGHKEPYSSEFARFASLQ